MKVAVCIPAHRDTRAAFTLSLARMVQATASRPVLYNGDMATPDLRFHMVHCSRVDIAREKLAKVALEGEPDYLLWLDDDHTFPPDALIRLAAHDVPIVGCNYAMKGEGETSSTATRLADNKPVYLQPRADGLEEVHTIGFGLCLIKAPVFKLLPQPWFFIGNSGEDAFFCGLAKAHGIPVHVDHSIKVGHIGEKVYTL